MKKARFFATLRFARNIKQAEDKELRQLALKAFQYGYEMGWQRKTN